MAFANNFNAIGLSSFEKSVGTHVFTETNFHKFDKKLIY